MVDCITRICTKCGAEHPATTEFFRKKKGGWLGLEAQCRECRNKQARNYPSSKSEKKRISKAAHAKRSDVAERRRQRRRERYATDLEFKEHILKKNNESRTKNPEVTKAKKADEYQRHKDKYRKSHRKHYLENRDIYIEKARQQKPNPISVIVRAERRLARKRALPDTLTNDQWIACLEYFNHCCAVCGKLFDDDTKAYMDHWIPLSSPECTGTVVGNIICLCGGVGGCNESKHNRKAELWLLDFYSLQQATEILDRVMEYFAKVRGS